MELFSVFLPLWARRSLETGTAFGKCYIWVMCTGSKMFSLLLLIEGATSEAAPCWIFITSFLAGSWRVLHLPQACTVWLGAFQLVSSNLCRPHPAVPLHMGVQLCNCIFYFVMLCVSTSELLWEANNRQWLLGMSAPPVPSGEMHFCWWKPNRHVSYSWILCLIYA